MILFLKKHSTLILVAAILFFVSTIFFGLDFSDSFYHLNYAKNHSGDEINFFIILSVYLTKFFSSLASDNIIVYRIINTLFIISRFLIPLFVLKKEDRDLKRLLIAFLLFIYSPFLFNIFGYDTFSSFFLVVTYVIFYKFYFAENNKKLIFALGVLTALSILSRFPNVFLVFVLAFGIYFKNDLGVKARIINVFQYLLTVSLILVVFYYFIYRNVEILLNSQVISESHNLRELILNYLINLKSIFFYFVINALVILTLQLRHKFLYRVKYVIIFLILLLATYLLAKNFILFRPYSKSLGLFYTSFSMVVIFMAFLDSFSVQKSITIFKGKDFRQLIKSTNKINAFKFLNKSVFFLVTASFFF